jgi:hypothetical protein
VTSYANLKNKQGAIMDASAVNVTAELEHPGTGWPIPSTFYVFMRNDSVDCERQRQFYKFLYWTRTNHLALTQVYSLGYAPLPQNDSDFVLQSLLNAKCNNRLILEIRVEKMHDSNAFLGFLSTSMILLGNFKISIHLIIQGISIFLLICWFFANPTSRSNIPILFYQILQFSGITTVYISVIFW